jgi:hypothetical protein
MGIGAEEILEMIVDLKESIVYWQTCQPNLVPEELMPAVCELERKLQGIIESER